MDLSDPTRPGISCPNAWNSSSSGWNRSAAAGTRSVSSARAVSMCTVAVIPGFSFNPGFGTLMIVV